MPELFVNSIVDSPKCWKTKCPRFGKVRPDLERAPRLEKRDLKTVRFGNKNQI
jgi:hypothetical protein